MVVYYTKACTKLLKHVLTTTHPTHSNDDDEGVLRCAAALLQRFPPRAPSYFMTSRHRAVWKPSRIDACWKDIGSTTCCGCDALLGDGHDNVTLS